jgi:predicted TIM-barrel fold metal-dependent hydrolase
MPTRRALPCLTAGLLLAASRFRGIAHAASDWSAPPGSCDCHVHVIGDVARFPMDPGRNYTPELASSADLKRRLDDMGLDRVVIVAPTIYGSDASATLAAVADLGRHRARGSIFVQAGAARRDLERMSNGGIVAMRLFLTDGDSIDRDLARKRLQAATDMAQALGWHLQIAAPPEAVVAVARELLASPIPFVLDAFGWLAGGVTQPGFETIRTLLKAGVGYAKLAEPYKLSKRAPDYTDVNEVARALVDANPDRVLWGSGWPHVPSDADPARRLQITPPLPVDTRRMLQLLQSWAPDPAYRRRILVDNPARLFGFA